MITISQALTKFSKENKDRRVKKVFDYNGNYLVFAPDKRLFGKEDYSDPYFIIDSKTSEIKHFLPTTDINGFTKALRKEIK